MLLIYMYILVEINICIYYYHIKNITKKNHEIEINFR